MSSKPDPPPPVASETLRGLLAAAGAFSAAKPWESMHDSDVVGLTDSATGEIRLASILGWGGEVFGGVFYRRASGLRWILTMLEKPEAMGNLDSMAGMDALKVEFIPKRQMLKEDLATLQVLGFRPSGKGCVWPQFQSFRPGWLPWFIDQKEAEQLLSDLPRLALFCTLIRQQADLFENRAPSEIPFLPRPIPDRPLQVEDLDWRPLLVPPAADRGFETTQAQLDQLRLLPRVPKGAYEYGCSVMLGGGVLENLRPCYSRVGLLVEHRRGLVLGFDLSLATISFGESAGNGLVKTLLHNGFLPGTVWIADQRLETILEPLCGLLEVTVAISDSLPALEEAMASVGQYMDIGRL